MIELLIRAIIAGTPLLLASLGELITERSGVLNLGVEGAFVLGVAAGYVSTVITGNAYIGLLVGGIAGALIGLIHGLVSVCFRAHQVISGLALTMFGYGLASLFGRVYVGIPLPTYLLTDRIWYIILVLSVIFSLVLWYMIFKLKLGVIIRSVGENPYSASVLGVDVVKVRVLCTVIGSFMVGVGGAWFTLGYLHIWTEGLGMGRGWISLAIVIVAGWNPILAPVFSYLFGCVEAAIWTLQLPPYNIDPFILGMLPYIVTLVALTIFMATPLKKFLKPPAALGYVYFREERTV